MKIIQPRFTKIFAAHDEAEKRAEYASVTWAECLAELEASDLVTKSRLNILKRYVLARTDYEFLYPSYSFEGVVKTGPNGGEVFSMKYSALLKLNDQIMKMEDSLLISPKSAGNKVSEKKPETVVTKADKYLDRNATAH